MRILYLAFFLVFLSCESKKTARNPIYKDTTIVIYDFQKAADSKVLDTSKAKNVLEKHFRSEGFLIEDELEFGETVDPSKLAMDYHKTVRLDAHSAIVQYFKCEPFANGNWVRPHFAILALTQSGEQIVHDEFITPNFEFDSIATENGKPVIYGYSCDCVNDIKLQSYRVELE